MQKITDILHKDMSRKEFLATLGFGIATIAGFSTILKMLGKENPWQQDHQATQQFGYGGGAYGGQKRA
jgi:Trp operon repressor